MSENFRWRTNPTVIARYMMGHHVPHGAELTLKPNEACVVVENGRVAGVASQQQLEVNPRLGLLSRMLGRPQPDRAFLFVFLGPHDLLVPIEVTISDGTLARGLVALRAAFTPETAARLLQVPAKGAHEITVDELARTLSPEVQAHLAPRVRSMTLDALHDADAMEDALAALRLGLRPTLEAYGLNLQHAFTTWKEDEARDLMRMRRDLEHLVERQAIVDATAQAEMDAMFQERVRQVEQQARLLSVTGTAEARAQAQTKAEQIKANAEVEKARWASLAAVEAVQHDARRTQEIAEAKHQVEMARLEGERRASTLAADLGEQEGKAKVAMDLFEQVQARKRERMAMDEAREQHRLEGQQASTDKALEALIRIAETSDDPQVATEALRQIAELRRTDAEGARDAYLNSDG